MDSSLFPIIIAYVIFLVLLLWFLILSKGWWLLKCLIVAGTLYFSTTFAVSLYSLQGWATTQEPPEKFEILWLDVKNPNAQNNDEGAIYMWAKSVSLITKDITLWGEELNVSFYKPEKDSPRSYKLPYSKLLHEQSQQIREAIIKSGGRGFLATLGKSSGQGNGEGEGLQGIVGDNGADGSGKGRGGVLIAGRSKDGDGSGGFGSLTEGGDIMFYALPPPVFPPKDTFKSE